MTTVRHAIRERPISVCTPVKEMTEAKQEQIGRNASKCRYHSFLTNSTFERQRSADTISGITLCPIVPDRMATGRMNKGRIVRYSFEHNTTSAVLE